MKMRILDKYQNYSIILPLAVMCIGSLGRGVQNSLMFLYFLSGLIGIVVYLRKIDNRSGFLPSKTIPIVVIWILIFVGSFWSTIYNDALDVGMKQWLVALLSSSVLFFVLVHTKNIRQFFQSRLLFVLPFIPVFVLSFDLAKCYLDARCVAASHVSPTSVPLLVAFILIPFYKSMQHRRFIPVILIFSFIFVLLLLADSRTEVLAFGVVCLTLMAFYFRKIWTLLLIPLLLLIIIFPYANFIDDARKSGAVLYKGDVTDFIYKTSSNRIAIWERAIRNPPENSMLGSGINNTMAYLPKSRQNSALHDAYLEIWYETGFLGLGLWFLLFTLLLKNLRKAYLYTNKRHRLLYAIFLSSFVAVLVEAFLDKGYMSSYITFYSFYLGAALHVLARKEAFKKYDEFEHA